MNPAFGGDPIAFGNWAYLRWLVPQSSPMSSRGSTRKICSCCLPNGGAMLYWERIARSASPVPGKSIEMTPSKIAATMVAPVESARVLRTRLFFKQLFGLVFFSAVGASGRMTELLTKPRGHSSTMLH